MDLRLTNICSAVRSSFLVSAFVLVCFGYFFFLQINQDLVSARAGIKFCLGDGSRVKWSKLRPKAQRIVDQCLACWDGKDVILSSPGRWDEPQMSEQTMYVFEKLVKQSESSSTAHVSSSGSQQSVHAADVWAAAMNTQLFRKIENLHQFLNTNGTTMKHQYIAFWIGSTAPATTTGMVLRPSQNDRLSQRIFKIQVAIRFCLSLFVEFSTILTS